MTLRAERRAWTRRYLLRVLSEHPTVTAAAAAAGVNRTHFTRLCTDHGIANPHRRCCRREVSKLMRSWGAPRE